MSDRFLNYLDIVIRDTLERLDKPKTVAIRGTPTLTAQRIAVNYPFDAYTADLLVILANGDEQQVRDALDLCHGDPDLARRALIRRVA